MQSEEVCEYINLFYKIEKVPPGAAAKNYFKKKKKRWCVLSMDLTPVNCRLVHYDKESSWLKNKHHEGQGENLSELSDVCVLDDRDKSHVLQLEFTYCSLFMSFDSKTKLDTWRQKLNLLLDRYTVQLIRCPEQPSRIGIYVLQLTWAKIDVYYVNTLELAWSWEITHLRRFNFHASVPDVEVEAGTRSSTGEGHFFFTGVHMRRLFQALKSRVTTPSSSKEIATPPVVPPPRNAQSTRVRSKSEWNPPVTEVFNFSQRSSELCLASDNVFSPGRLQSSTDTADSDFKSTGEAAGYVKMHPFASMLSTSDTHTITQPAAINTHQVPTKSHIYEPADAVCDSQHLPTLNNYDVPRPTHGTRILPVRSYGSSSGCADSDDDLDFMDQWKIDQALQSPAQPLATTEQLPYQPSSQHNSEVPLQANPSYTAFEILKQANDNYDYIHPSVFKSQVTNT